MSEKLAAYPLGIIKTIAPECPGWVERLLLGGMVLAAPGPEVRNTEHDFEDWLVEKWLAQIRSNEFRQSAEGEYLRAQWERDT